MLGEKIRKLRQDLKLSQQQLAGKEMTRAFISLVESGKCKPSPDTLRLIAQRLGRSVEFFLHDGEEADTTQVITVLLDSARRDLESERFQEAQSKLQQAFKFCTVLDRPDFEGQICSLKISVLRMQGKHEEILETADRALECYRSLGDREQMALIYQVMGASAYWLEDFSMARRAYEKAVLYATGLKMMAEFRVEVLTVLGTCLFRLGEYPEAIERYQEAIAECAVQNSGVRRGKLMMGLGWVLFRSGDLQAAWHWTRQAVEIFKHEQNYDYALVKHNLAIIEGARGNWEQSYVILQECLKTYKAQGRSDRQASAYEDIARYWLHKGDYERAESIGWVALDLLELKDDGVVRGRLYRLLGTIAADQGNLVQARNLLRISFALFRRLKASSEVAMTQSELEQVQVRMDSLAASPKDPND